MKRISFIIITCLLVLGMLQCKKENQIGDNETEGVKITLTVDNSNAKADIVPGETVASVSFSTSDKILVANGGRYVGYLWYDDDGNTFNGTITANLSIDDKLHFFFVGDRVNVFNMGAGETSCTIDMSDQWYRPAVISYASIDYDGSYDVTAKVKLLNKASGLVKFTASTGTTNDITISGMHTEMSITFGTTPTIAPTETIGTMKLYRYTGDSENKTFLAVIPVQDAVVSSTVTVSGFTTEIISVPAVTENLYYHDNGIDNTGVKMTLDPTLSGEFTVSTTGKKVRFSKGNLEATYDGSNWIWAFAEVQNFAVGSWPANTSITGNGTVSPEVVGDSGNNIVDLFGWSTSSTTYGIHNSTDNSDYLGSFVDWGNVIIRNGANYNWRTLSAGEWNYLLNNHIRDFCQVGGRYGLAIRPDDSTSSFMSVYTDDAWMTEEANGAVFLPAGGYRTGIEINYGSNSSSAVCNYWSSSTSSDVSYHQAGFFLYRPNPFLMGVYSEDRCVGRSVRLVRDIN